MTYMEMKKLLTSVDDAAMKLELVMDFGRDLPNVPDDAVCTEIVGCTSFVQICQKENMFFARADSALVRGIVAILIAMVDGMSRTEIKNIDILSEFKSLGINLGAGRLGGLNSMVRFFHNL